MNAASNLPGASNYSTGQVRTRIGVYVAIATLTAASSGVLNIASMSDDQLAHITGLRWTLMILPTLFSVALAGFNAFRAAIDRSTAGGNDVTVTPPDSSTPHELS